MVTRKDVAELAKVSVMTVTRVVTKSGYVSDDARYRVEKAIEELHYIPNKLASSLGRKNGKMIAVLLQELSNPYYMHIAESMIERARESGYSLLLLEVRNGDPQLVMKDAISNRVAGVLNLLFDPFPENLLEQLCTYNIRSIYTGQSNNFKFKITYDKAIEQAVAHLYKCGCRKPIFVLGTRFGGDERVIKFKKEVQKYSMKLDDDSILFGRYPLVESYATGYNVMKKFFSEGRDCDAVFCLNDMMALGAIRAIVESGRKIPNDVAIIGFDNIVLDAYFSPSLTSIGVDYKEQARSYADYLTGRIDDADIVMTAEFYPRESTAKVFEKISK